MKRLMYVSVIALAAVLSGCIYNPVHVDRANLSVYANRVE